MAHGGTLLLKEVADLPVPLQSRLARVLQEQSFTRDGGTTKVEVDVRVLASTAHAPAGRDRGRRVSARSFSTG